MQHLCNPKPQADPVKKPPRSQTDGLFLPVANQSFREVGVVIVLLLPVLVTKRVRGCFFYGFAIDVHGVIPDLMVFVGHGPGRGFCIQLDR